MYKTGQSNPAIDAIGAVLNFISSDSPAAAVARSQCASFKKADTNVSHSGAAGVTDLAAALGLSSPEFVQEVANSALIGNSGDVSGEALRSWASALDARLAPLVYIVNNKLSAVDIAVAVQIKLRLFPSGTADKSLAGMISPSHVRFFNNIFAIVGRGSGSSVFASELKHPGGIKATLPTWPESTSSLAAVHKAGPSKPAGVASTEASVPTATAEKKEKAAAPAASAASPAAALTEKKEKAAKAEKPKEPEPPKSKGNDASALDIRVGVVCTCTNHPEADKLYVAARCGLCCTDHLPRKQVRSDCRHWRRPASSGLVWSSRSSRAVPTLPAPLCHRVQFAHARHERRCVHRADACRHVCRGIKGPSHAS
jgi:tRNA-binding EMAP/Myf-like protein